MKIVHAWNEDAFIVEIGHDELEVLYPGGYRFKIGGLDLLNAGLAPAPRVRDGVNVVFDPDGIIRKADDSKPASFHIKHVAMPITIAVGDLDRAIEEKALFKIFGECDCGAQKTGTLPHSSWCSKEKANASGQ